MLEFINGLINGIKSNWEVITFGTFMATITGVAGYWVTKKVIPALIDTFLLYLAKIMAKLTGVPVDGVSDVIQKLPFVDNLKKASEELHQQNEIKLMELKNKLVSPKLSEAERLAYQGIYDKLMDDMGDTISIQTLDAIEKAAKEKFNL